MHDASFMLPVLIGSLIFTVVMAVLWIREVRRAD